MTVDLQPLTVTLVTPDHQPRVGALVSIRVVAPDDLDELPSQLVEGIVAATTDGEIVLTSHTVEKKTDQDGVAVFELLPSELSRFGLRYEAEIEGARIRFSMPDAPTDLGALFGQATPDPLTPVTPTGGGAIIVQDEGSTISDDVTTLNLVGTGVEATAQGDVVTIAVSSTGLPSGTPAENRLRWNDTTSSWEAFSSVGTYYWALTPTIDMQPIANVMIDALTNGFNRAIRGARPTHYNPSVGEAVLSTQPLPAALPVLAYYPINGAAGSSWEADAARGRAASVAAIAAFNISTVYSWIILAEDVSGAFLANRYWNVRPTHYNSSEPPGVLANTPAFGRVNKDLIVNGVTFVAARARLEWEPGTTIHNFELTFNPQQDAPTAVWVTP